MLSEQVLILPQVNSQVKMEMRDRILDAADRVLQSKGLAGTTTRAVTTEAGCAEGTLYLYFKGRAELFLALFERRLASAFPSLETLEARSEEATPNAILLDVAQQFLRFHHETAPLLAGLFAEPQLLKKYRDLILARHPSAPRAAPILVNYLRREQRRKRIRSDLDPAVVAEALLGACFSRAIHDNMFGDRQSEAEERKFLRSLIASLID